MKHLIIYLTLAAGLAGLLIVGCSEKIVNQNGAATRVRIAAPAALSSGFATYARIKVNGPEMAPMNVPLAFDSAANAWAGSLDVPAGLSREFVLEAIDTIRGEGSFPDSEEVLYYAADTVDLTANRTDTLHLTLFPVVPMLTLAPMSKTVHSSDTFSLSVNLYYSPANLFYMSTRVYFENGVILADSVRFNLPANDSLITLGVVRQDSGYATITVSESNRFQTLFKQQPYVQVAKLYCHLDPASAKAGPHYFFVGFPDMFDTNQLSLVPTNMRIGYSIVTIITP